MTVDFAKLQEIFLSAVERHRPEEWEAYVYQACGDDAELRRQVNLLLKAHLEAGSVPGAAPSEPAQTAAHEMAAEAPGLMIGPYKLLEQIGEGGMGTVWMAQQEEPVKRVVALKLIKAGMDTKQVIARFEAERQALALMDHPNIAKVLDGGTTVSSDPINGVTTSGRPYFVMDLVKGVPITRYCDEHHLTPRQRLELFIPVCQAVQHAHQKGIIHRDLKPSNVLVALYDGKPVPKVIDFGVAKATGQSLTEKTLVTGFGSIVGTLEYMSPEQAEINQLDIDTRSDIYSLGVLLYELLAGSPPFSRKELEKAGMLEMLRVIREQEPSKPSTKLSSSDALPTLSANRGTEPAKLTKLVRGELDWIVMKALEKDRNRRYETANGFARDVQRYLADEPVLACPPSAGYRLRKFVRRNKGPVMTVSFVLIALLAGIIGTTIGFVRATAERDDKEKARQEAVLSESRAREAAEAERKAKETAETRAAEIKAVLEFVEGKIFAAARPEDQAGGLGRKVTLRQAVEAAVPFVEESFTEQPLIEARLRMTLGQSFMYLGDAKKALEQFDAARAIHSKQLGPDHRDTLRSITSMANSYNALGRLAEALKLREETVARLKSSLGSEDPATLTGMSNLANSYFGLARYADALKLREETLAIQKATLGPDHVDTLLSMSNLANSYHAARRHPEAFKLREVTLALRKAKLGPGHPDTLRSMYNLAVSYTALEKYAEAHQLREETLALQKARLGLDHPDTLTSMDGLARSHHQAGRYGEAVKLHEETLALRKIKRGLDHSDTLWSMSGLANSYVAVGRHAEALKLREETVALQTAKLGHDHPDTLASMTNLGNSYNAAGRYAEALKLREKTLALQKGKLGLNDPSTLLSMNNLAWFLATCPEPKFRDHGRAVELANQVVKGRPKHGPSWNTLGVARYRTSDWKAALVALEKSVELTKGGDASDWLFLATVHWQLGDKQQARKWFDQAVAWMDKQTSFDPLLRHFRAEAELLIGTKNKE